MTEKQGLYDSRVGDTARNDKGEVNCNDNG